MGSMHKNMHRTKSCWLRQQFQLRSPAHWNTPGATLSSLGRLSAGNNLWGKLYADIQQMSSSAIPYSGMNFVAVFLELLDLQDGKVKENLKKKGGGIKMQKDITKFSNLFLSFLEGSTKWLNLQDNKIKPK